MDNKLFTGKTSSGFEFEIPADNLDNMELYETLAENEKGTNPIGWSKSANMLLGSEQKKRLYEHVRESGRVPITRIAIEINEIFQIIGESGKNS